MLVFYRAGALAIFLLPFLENVMKRFSFNQGSRALFVALDLFHARRKCDRI